MNEADRVQQNTGLFERENSVSTIQESHPWTSRLLALLFFLAGLILWLRLL